jgi:succinate dehydrogenase flavin-adding protein (antitoxin of CptAB toxin-antitoxin module)
MTPFFKTFLYPFLLLSLLTGCRQEAEPIRHRLIYNSDGTDALGNFLFDRRPLSKDDMNAYVDKIAGTQVTTFMMCSGSDFMYYRSDFGRVLGDDLDGKLKFGNDTLLNRYLTDYYRNHLNLEKEGTDIIDASLRRAKENGMEAFISFRMNDLHFNDTSLHCPVVYPEFWAAHPEYWMNEDIGWNSARALDFSIKEVRDHKLNIITEQLEKYGDLLDGYDLDFMRFIVYFKMNEGEKNAPLMTELVRMVRSRINKISAKKGKKILLSVRVPTDLDFCLKKGLDVKEWVRLGLIDFVSIGIHWIGNPAMPVAKFKRGLGESSIPVYASIDDGGYNPRELYSHGMYRGMSSHILSQGGEGIYLFNYFFGKNYYGQLYRENCDFVCSVRTTDLLNELGTLETLRKRNKIYSLDDGGSAAYGYMPETPLPLDVLPETRKKATIFVGDNVHKDSPQEIILFLRTDEPAAFDILVNEVKIEIQKPDYVTLFNRTNNLQKNEKVYAFILPASCLKQGDNEILIHSFHPEAFIVKRIEVALKYGDVKTHGYF